jgi:glycosyltransferase involved in cell wall biosynthesis
VRHRIQAGAEVKQVNPRRVVVLNDFSVAHGGAESIALLAVKLLRQRDIAVTFVAGDDGDNPLFAEEHVPIVAMAGRRLLDASSRSAALHGLYNRRTISVVSDWIRRNDTFDTVYHLHTWSQILSPSVFSALDSVRDRTFITAHDFFLVCPNGAYALFKRGQVCPLTPLSPRCVVTSCDRRSYVHKLWRVARQCVQARLLTYASGKPRILAIYEAMRPLLERGGVPAAAITTMPNPISPWSATRIQAERNAGFVFVGRLTGEKGPDLAARAARRAGVPLTIIGDGPMLEHLKRAYPEIALPGRQPPEILSTVVRSARALVWPSRYPEPCGLVAGEALWSGLPVIATEQALIAPEIVARGAGLSCNPHDEEALATALTYLAQNDEVARQMSINAFEQTRHLGTTPKSWVDALIGIYSEAVSPILIPA